MQKIGKEKVFMPIIGKESLHNESNYNGIRLIDFALGEGMTAAPRFHIKCTYSYLELNLDGVIRNQIYYVQLDSRHGSDILEDIVRSYRGANADTDYLLSRVKYNQIINIIQNCRNQR